MRCSLPVSNCRVVSAWRIFGPRPPTVAVEVYEGNPRAGEPLVGLANRVTR